MQGTSNVSQSTATWYRHKKGKWAPSTLPKQIAGLYWRGLST